MNLIKGKIDGMYVYYDILPPKDLKVLWLNSKTGEFKYYDTNLKRWEHYTPKY
jgi:hypothetical protein